VTRADVVRFIEEIFKVKVTEQSANNYMTQLGFSFRTVRTKAKGYLVDSERQVEMLVEWTKQHRKAGHFKDTLVSFDFTYTSAKSTPERSFSLKAAPNLARLRPSLKTPTAF
jgi:hypothetical protein